jgi:hypothetical protein
VAEGNGLLNRHTLQGVSRVRIPPSPPFFPGPFWNTLLEIAGGLACDILLALKRMEEDAQHLNEIGADARRSALG